MPVIRRSGAEADAARAARALQAVPMDAFSERVFESTMEKGYRGTLYEVDALSSMKKTAAYEAAYKKLTGSDTKDGNGYFGDISKMMELVREHSVADPLRPIKPIAKGLREALIKRLRLSPQEATKLRFYSAVQSGFLDSKHHIDGWFEYVPDQGAMRWIGIDVTKRQVGDKKDVQTSISVNRIPPDPETEDEKRAFAYLIDKYANELAKQLEQTVEQDRRNRSK